MRKQITREEIEVILSGSRNFKGFIFVGDVFEGLTLSKTTFINCHFVEVGFGRLKSTESYFLECEFSSSWGEGFFKNLNHTVFDRCVFNNEVIGANFTDAVFFYCEFREDLFDCDFSDTEIMNSKFSDITIAKCYFINSIVYSANFSRTRFIELNLFSGSKIRGVDFSGIIIPKESSISFRGATFEFGNKFSRKIKKACDFEDSNFSDWRKAWF